MLKKLITSYLKILAKIKLARMRAQVIGITGSYGKTSTKEAVYAVMKTKYKTLQSQKSLNTDIGMCLAILEQESGFSSASKWLVILFRAKLNALFGKKYDYLVLEYGVDTPGDMDRLLSITRPDIAIITHIAAVHQALGQFNNKGEVFEEKKKLALAAKKAVILNGNDTHLKTLENKLHVPTYWFNGTDIHTSHVEQTHAGLAITFNRKHEKVAEVFPFVGLYQADILQPAVLTGTLTHIDMDHAAAGLLQMKLPPGRMSLIEGLNGSSILDSTYNASPETVIAGLDVLKTFPGTRRIAVLGNMNELGDHTAEAHKEVGKHIPREVDILLTVGESAKLIATEALLSSEVKKDRIIPLHTAEEAADYLRKLPLKKGDVVLFKGSQNKVRLERAVKVLMAHPEQASELLCRQEAPWQSIN